MQNAIITRDDSVIEKVLKPVKVTVTSSLFDKEKSNTIIKITKAINILKKTFNQVTYSLSVHKIIIRFNVLHRFVHDFFTFLIKTLRQKIYMNLINLTITIPLNTNKKKIYNN